MKKLLIAKTPNMHNLGEDLNNIWRQLDKVHSIAKMFAPDDFMFHMGNVILSTFELGKMCRSEYKNRVYKGIEKYVPNEKYMDIADMLAHLTVAKGRAMRYIESTGGSNSNMKKKLDHVDGNLSNVIFWFLSQLGEKNQECLTHFAAVCLF
jgi:hypothetical protein